MPKMRCFGINPENWYNILCFSFKHLTKPLPGQLTQTSKKKNEWGKHRQRLNFVYHKCILIVVHKGLSYWAIDTKIQINGPFAVKVSCDYYSMKVDICNFLLNSHSNWSGYVYYLKLTPIPGFVKPSSNYF